MIDGLRSSKGELYNRRACYTKAFIRFIIHSYVNFFEWGVRANIPLTRLNTQRSKSMRMKLKLLLGLLFSSYLAVGQDPQITRIDGKTISITAIDSTVIRLMGGGRVSGLGLTIINGDTIAYEKAYGYKNRETKELLDTSTVYYGASLSKAVFMYLCLALVGQGVLNLDKPLYQYLDK